MSETHINVYFAAVEDAKVKIAQAKGNLEMAETELKAKKSEVGYEDEPTEELVADESQDEATKDEVKETADEQLEELVEESHHTETSEKSQDERSEQPVDEKSDEVSE